jgi:branched-chain amino acid transport system ATP-binding protein
MTNADLSHLMQTSETSSIEAGMVLLEASEVKFSYGAIRALNGVDLEVRRGEAVCVIGPNGAGKTTLARVLGGIYKPKSGTVTFKGVPLPRRSHRVVHTGIASVLEGRRLFPGQSVRVNLEMGAYALPWGESREKRMDEVLELFPKLRQRFNQRTSTLSGGEQQMVAIGRALMAEPVLLILDEPSMGLAPKVSGEVFDVLIALKAKGLAILLVEQNTELAFELAERAYVLQYGAIVALGTVDEIVRIDHVRRSYLGGEMIDG